jgi:transporter family protein
MWLIYAILAAIFWGSYIIASKVATSPKYFGINQNVAGLLMLLGIAIVFIVNFIFGHNLKMPQNKSAIFFGILAGILWAMGMVASLKALKIGADVSRLVPIFNTNTLIAVLLGIILLGEIPKAAAMVKVIIGAILIVLGSILVAF